MVHEPLWGCGPRLKINLLDDEGKKACDQTHRRQTKSTSISERLPEQAFEGCSLLSAASCFCVPSENWGRNAGRSGRAVRPVRMDTRCRSVSTPIQRFLSGRRFHAPACNSIQSSRSGQVGRRGLCRGGILSPCGLSHHAPRVQDAFSGRFRQRWTCHWGQRLTLGLWTETSNAFLQRLHHHAAWNIQTLIAGRLPPLRPLNSTAWRSRSTASPPRSRPVRRIWFLCSVWWRSDGAPRQERTASRRTPFGQSGFPEVSDNIPCPARRLAG